jgi:hypothetical protein
MSDVERSAADAFVTTDPNPIHFADASEILGSTLPKIVHASNSNPVPLDGA